MTNSVSIVRTCDSLFLCCYIILHHCGGISIPNLLRIAEGVTAGVENSSIRYSHTAMKIYLHIPLYTRFIISVVVAPPATATAQPASSAV